MFIHTYSKSDDSPIQERIYDTKTGLRYERQANAVVVQSAGSAVGLWYYGDEAEVFWSSITVIASIEGVRGSWAE